MCLWLLTACIGLLPVNPTQFPIVVVQGVPSPILQPTAVPSPIPSASPGSMTPPPGSVTPPPASMPSPPGSMPPPPGSMPPPPGSMPPPPGSMPTPPGSMAPPPASMPPPPGSMPPPPGSMPPPPASMPPPPGSMPPPPGSMPPPPGSMPPPPGSMPPPPGSMPPPPGSMPPPPASMPPPPGSMPPPPGSMPPPPGSMTPPSGNFTTGSSTVKSDEVPLVTTMNNLILSSSNTNTLTAISMGDGDIVLCNNPVIVCVSNPYETITGAPMIDPRLGTTPVTSAALLGPPIISYNGQLPSFDTAVKFPRQRRSASDQRVNMKQYLKEIRSERQVGNENHEITKRQSCMCVPTGTCATPNYGAGMIDVRIVTPGSASCPPGQVYCCTGQTTIDCGIVQNAPQPAIAPAVGQANYGEYPWQAIILTKQNDYVAGGVLIDALNVLTVTHRLTSFVVSGTAPNLKVRLGEWDVAGIYEPVPFQEYTIKKVFSHPSFVATTLQNDITVLRLSQPVPFTPSAGAALTINRACLPPASNALYVGRRCWVSGWGKDMFGTQGQYQQILKEVEVPIVASSTCETQLRTARLGPSYILDTNSFICAGGEADHDACTGDGGSGLVCESNGKWTVVGLVSWGLGCANPSVPGVYVNVAAFLPWIQEQITAAA